MNFIKNYSKYRKLVLNFIQKNTKYRNLLILLGVAVILGAAVLLITRTTIAARSAAEQRAAVFTITPFPNNPLIQELQVELRDKGLTKPARESVLEKLTMAERLAADQAAGASRERKEKEAPLLPPSASLMNDALNVPEKVFSGSQGMIRPSMAQISNCWQGVRDGKVVQVFAGSLPDLSRQGILVIFQEDPEQMKRTMNIVQAPGKTGMLRILSVRGNVVTLQAEDISKLIFSLETMEFRK